VLVVAGLILLADWAVFRGAVCNGAGGAHAGPLLVQYARSFFPVVLIVLLLAHSYSNRFEYHRVDDAGLVAGDFIFVNKFAYGLRCR